MVQPNPEFVLIITAVAFLTLFLFCIGLIQYSRVLSKRRELVDRIRSGGTGEAMVEYGPAGKRPSLGNLLAGFLGRFGARYAPQDAVDYSKMRVKFLRAGIRRENAASIQWGCKLFLLLLLPSVFLVCCFTLFQIASDQMTLLIAIFLALTGFYAPDIWLQNKAAHRKEKLLEALPDTLDLLVVCVEAGIGLDAAFSKVAQEIQLSNPELSDELKLLNLELRAGKSRQSALRNLAKRSGLEEMESLITLLIQTDRFGTSVANALQVFSNSFRTQRYQRAEEKAAKLPVKLIFPLILFIFPALFVVIMGPAVIQIYKVFILR